MTSTCPYCMRNHVPLFISAKAGHFIWITSDGVSASSDTVDVERAAAGGFHVQLYSTAAPGFTDYFENLSPDTSDNPWLGKLWEEEFGCVMHSRGLLFCITQSTNRQKHYHTLETSHLSSLFNVGYHVI